MADDPPHAPRHRPLAVLIVAVLGGMVTASAVLALVVIGGVGTLGVSPDADTGVAEQRRAAATDAAALTDGYRVWARNDDGDPVRWDPCRPIELVVDHTGAPDGFETDLRAAVSELEAASGLRLRIVGPTGERPSGSRLPYQPARYGERWAPVLIAWARPHAADLPLQAFDRGVAMPVAVGPAGDQAYVTGQVVFNRDRTDLDAGTDDRARSWGATILHELAHLIGLAHVDDPDELMYTYPGSGPVELGPGDRAGLAELGSGSGCRPAPRPGPVEITGRS